MGEHDEAEDKSSKKSSRKSSAKSSIKGEEQNEETSYTEEIALNDKEKSSTEHDEAEDKSSKKSSRKSSAKSSRKSSIKGEEQNDENSASESIVENHTTLDTKETMGGEEGKSSKNEQQDVISED